MNASLTTWGDLGNGLLVTMSVPAAHLGDVNELNRLDGQARGATHFVGAWAPFKGDAVYLIFLPAALLEQDIAWPVVMREILLTFARQAQLARRVVLDPATQKMLDGGTVQPVGLEASLKPRGLAWGETGEGMLGMRPCTPRGTARPRHCFRIDPVLIPARLASRARRGTGPGTRREHNAGTFDTRCRTGPSLSYRRR